MLQLSWIWAVINSANTLSCKCSIHDHAIKIYLHVIKNFDALIWQDDMSSEYTLNGKPVFYEFV